LKSQPLRVSCLASLLLAACEPAPTPHEEPLKTLEQGLLQPQGVNMQGVNMQGIEGSGLAVMGFRLSSFMLPDGVPVVSASLEAGELVVHTARGVLRGTELAGASVSALLSNGEHRRVHIVRVLPEFARMRDASTFRYELREPYRGGMSPLCGADADGTPTALAVAGWWDPTGKHRPDPDLFTFSCADGVIAKCYRWGYRPWMRDGALAKAHQACTRMARADYCGDGRSFTRPGTLINVADGLTPPVQTATPDAGMSFEAGWTVDGATCFSHRRWLEVKDQIHDNRCTTHFETAAGECDTAEKAFNSDAGVLLVNESLPQLLDGGTVGR
jgi:hypothetical protein